MLLLFFFLTHSDATPPPKKRYAIPPEEPTHIVSHPTKYLYTTLDLSPPLVVLYQSQVFLL